MNQPPKWHSVCAWRWSTSSPGIDRRSTQRKIWRVQLMCASTAASSSMIKSLASAGRLGVAVFLVTCGSAAVLGNSWRLVQASGLNIAYHAEPEVDVQLVFQPAAAGGGPA